MTNWKYCCLIILIIIPEHFSGNRDPASEQLENYLKTHDEKETIVTQFGNPADDIISNLKAGRLGPMLLSDKVFLDLIQSFDRERIPERVVHAKGAGAFGYFEVTNDITHLCKAVVFEKVGKKTPIAVRFSTVIGESGSADTLRDPRGFPIKFYTKDGIWDLVGLNTPVFFLRDPLLFPQLIHSFKKNPVTNLRDADSFWDFLTHMQQTVFQVMRLFSELGTPDGYRHMNGFGIHAFKLVNKKDDAVYVKFHYLTDQGIRNLTIERAEELSGEDADYATRDLYNAIAEKNFPSWTLYIQVMTFKQAEYFRWNPFDLTKIWPEDQFPLIPVGRIVLNRNPKNYFTDVEEIGFNPAHMIPGIEPSPDPMLHARMFSYGDTQRHRLGGNFLQLPVNHPRQKVYNYQRAGTHCIENKGGAPNYFPNSFDRAHLTPKAALARYKVKGDVARYNTSEEDNYSQAKMFWESLSVYDKGRMIHNIKLHLENAAEFLQERAIEMFSRVHHQIANRLINSLKKT